MCRSDLVYGKKFGITFVSSEKEAQSQVDGDF